MVSFVQTNTQNVVVFLLFLHQVLFVSEGQFVVRHQQVFPRFLVGHSSTPGVPL
jgi:hypothetical protein